jgi:6-phosphofructokinase 1
MAGRTGLVIGLVSGEFVHVPTDLLNSGNKRVDPNGGLWQSVLSTTGQPARMG